MQKSTLVLILAAFLHSGTVEAQTSSTIIDYQGFVWETDGFPPSSAGDTLNLVAVVDALDPIFNIDLDLTEITIWATQLVSEGEVDIGYGFTSTSFSGGIVEIWQDPGKNRQYGVHPPNASVPATFVDGTLLLGGEFTSFVLFYDPQTGSGAFEGTILFTSGTASAIALALGDAFTFGGLLNDVVSAGNVPEGYDLQVDGVIEWDNQLEGLAPDCSEALASIAELWPPNHNFVPVGITGITDPDGDDFSIVIDAITSDEPTGVIGSGNTCPDAHIENSVAYLRAERAGGGNGRVYTIHFTATDVTGLSCTGTVQVCVPHDRNPARICVDDGLDLDATTCEAPYPDTHPGSQDPAFRLHNKTGDSVELTLTLEKSGSAVIEVYDVLGRRVRRLVEHHLDRGRHQFTWHGRDDSGAEVAAGIYLIRLRADGVSATRKTVWMR